MDGVTGFEGHSGRVHARTREGLEVRRVGVAVGLEEEGCCDRTGSRARGGAYWHHRGGRRTQVAREVLLHPRALLLLALLPKLLGVLVTGKEVENWAAVGFGLGFRGRRGNGGG